MTALLVRYPLVTAALGAPVFAAAIYANARVSDFPAPVPLAVLAAAFVLWHGPVLEMALISRGRQWRGWDWVQVSHLWLLAFGILLFLRPPVPFAGPEPLMTAALIATGLSLLIPRRTAQSLAGPETDPSPFAHFWPLAAPAFALPALAQAANTGDTLKALTLYIVFAGLVPPQPLPRRANALRAVAVVLLLGVSLWRWVA